MKKDWRDPPHLALLFAALERHHVCYVLFETARLIAYGAVLSTGDLDICPAPDIDNLRYGRGLHPMSQKHGEDGSSCFHMSQNLDGYARIAEKIDHWREKKEQASFD